jgi:aldose 1-epimerase
LWSNQPGLQFYSDNFLDGTSYGNAHRINQPAFGSARLAPGQVYLDAIAYRLTAGAQ